jgi:ketosteroid isomerase-like protein
MRLHLFAGLVLVVATACQSRIDVTDVAKESQALLDADRAWSAHAAAGKDADSVLAYWSDDARVIMGGEPTVAGKDELRKMVARSFANPNFHIVWTPERAVVSRSGDLGYTVGTTEMTVTDAKGVKTTIPSRYLATWRKGADGRWRCVEDFASPSPTAPPATK